MPDDKKISVLDSEPAERGNKKNNLPLGRLIGRKRNLQRELAEVYTDGDGKVPDLTRLDNKERPAWKTTVYLLIGILSVLLVAAIAGFFIFTNLLSAEKFTNERVTVKIVPPLSVVSGQEGNYEIILTNNEKVNLYNASLEIIYPDNFVYASTTEPQATGDQNNLWDFSVIKSGETQKINLHGTLIASLGSVQSFKAILRFKPDNMNAEFKQEAVGEAKITSSVIELTLTGPDKALANQNIEYQIKVKNLSENNLSDVQIIADYPQGFVFASAEPEATESGSNNIWNLPQLLASNTASSTKPVATSTEKIIKIKGSYSAISGDGNQEFKARALIKYHGDYYPQSESTLVTNAVKDQLVLTLIVNGSGEDQPINLGDLLVYTLNFKNSGQVDLKNIELAAKLNSEILDWGTLKNDNNAKVRDGTIVFTGREVPKLLKLKPGEEGQVDWQIRVKDASVVADSNVSKFSVESSAEAKAQQSPGGDISVATKTITNAVSSDLSLKAAARYYNEDNLAMGLGPIQPKVGETSSYNIDLQLLNNLHDISGLKVIASLPKGVTWTNQEEHNTGDLVFDARNNQVIWTIERLPRSAKTTEANFNVSIKPGSGDSGKVLLLVSGINLTAKDVTTGADITKSVKAITTAFIDPIVGQQTGIVE